MNMQTGSGEIRYQGKLYHHWQTHEAKLTLTSNETSQLDLYNLKWKWIALQTEDLTLAIVKSEIQASNVGKKCRPRALKNTQLTSYMESR